MDKIPDAVRVMLKIHEANTEAKLVRIIDELDRTIVATSRSRVLRRYREQLAAELEAWRYLGLVSAAGYPHAEVSE